METLPKKRLLVLTSTFPKWADDTEPPFVYELCQRLSAKYTVHVLAPHYPGARTREQLTGMRVTRFKYFFAAWEQLTYKGGILANLKQKPWRYSLIPFFLIAEIFGIIRLHRKQRFDYIHAHWLFPQGFAAIAACWFMKKPPGIVCTSHGADLFSLKGAFFIWLKKLVFSNVTVSTVVSRAMYEYAMQIGADPVNLSIIPMGVDLKKRFVPRKKKKEGETLLFVGRLVEKKGLQYLIEALPLIQDCFPRVTLHVVGDGPKKKELENQTRRLAVASHVRFYGALGQEKLPEFYQMADVVVFPSVITKDGDQEGFGLVPVEALGCECAVVVTDLSAMQDIIEDGKTGIVVPQKNVNVMAEKIVYLLNNPDIGRSLGEKGREFVVKRYDWNHIVQQYTALFSSIS